MHKDTAKWLLTFVPIPAVLALGVGLGGRFTAIMQVGVISWVREFPVPVIAVVITILATIGIIAACCWVLVAGPTDLDKLKQDPDWWSDAFSKHGVGEPYFQDSDQYRCADDKRVDRSASEAEIDALAETIQRIRSLSEELTVRRRFKSFGTILGGCAVLIVVGLLVATATLAATPEASSCRSPWSRLPARMWDGATRYSTGSTA